LIGVSVREYREIEAGISPDASASSIIWRMTDADADADLRALLETLDPKA
jgi:hypothetical protein